MARLLWCRRCATGYASVAGDLPIVCPACAVYPAVWTTMAPQGKPDQRFPFELTDNDEKMLARHHCWVAFYQSLGVRL